MGSHQNSAAQGSTGRQLLTFRLGAETFGVDILGVKEIRGWVPVTAIPESPAHVLGVLNLRGTVVPITDLRLRFAMPTAEYTSSTVIIVLSLADNYAQRDIGIVVDSVSDVVDVPEGAEEAAPDFGGATRSGLVRGLAKLGEQMLIVLDVQALMAVDSATGEAVRDAA